MCDHRFERWGRCAKIIKMNDNGQHFGPTPILHTPKHGSRTAIQAFSCAHDTVFVGCSNAQKHDGNYRIKIRGVGRALFV